MRLASCLPFYLLLWGLSACQQNNQPSPKPTSSQQLQRSSQQVPVSSAGTVGLSDASLPDSYFQGVFNPARPSTFFDCATQESIPLDSSGMEATALLEQTRRQGGAPVYVNMRASRGSDGRLTIAQVNSVANKSSACADSLLLVGTYKATIVYGDSTINIYLKLHPDHTFKATAIQGYSPAAVVTGTWSKSSPAVLSLQTATPKYWIGRELAIYGGNRTLSWQHEDGRIAMRRRR